MYFFKLYTNNTFCIWSTSIHINVSHSQWCSLLTVTMRSFQELNNHIKFACCEFGYQFIYEAFRVSWWFWVNHLSRVTSPHWLHLWDHTCSTTALQKLPQLQIHRGEDSDTSLTQNICISHQVRHDVQTANNQVQANGQKETLLQVTLFLSPMLTEKGFNRCHWWWLSWWLGELFNWSNWAVSLIVLNIMSHFSFPFLTGHSQLLMITM